MKDRYKTKQQLIGELNELRQRFRSWPGQMGYIAYEADDCGNLLNVSEGSD